MLEREPSPLTNMLVWLFAYMLQQATVWAELCTYPSKKKPAHTPSIYRAVLIPAGLVSNRQRSWGQDGCISSLHTSSEPSYQPRRFCYIHLTCSLQDVQQERSPRRPCTAWLRLLHVPITNLFAPQQTIFA